MVSRFLKIQDLRQELPAMLPELVRATAALQAGHAAGELEDMIVLHSLVGRFVRKQGRSFGLLYCQHQGEGWLKFVGKDHPRLPRAEKAVLRLDNPSSPWYARCERDSKGNILEGIDSYQAMLDGLLKYFECCQCLSPTVQPVSVVLRGKSPKWTYAIAALACGLMGETPLEWVENGKVYHV